MTISSGEYVAKTSTPIPMDERVTKTPTPISVDLQAFQQLLATLMNTTDMEQRSNAERQLTMVMEQPLLACELLVSSIELDN